MRATNGNEMGPPEDKAAGGPEGVQSLSLPSRLAVALAVAVAAVAAAMHLLMVFLHVAPENTATRQYGDVVDEYVYPEFEQNWKLFAPNPLQQNIHVEARAEVRGDDGGLRTTGWYDLTGDDIDAIRGSAAPSHTWQNELRRAWSFYVDSHDERDIPDGLRGTLSEQYLWRIVEQRYLPRVTDGEAEQIQVRSVTTAIAPPAWSGERTDTTPVYRELPWRTVEREPEDGS